jgi:hypothetical protein
VKCKICATIYKNQVKEQAKIYATHNLKIEIVAMERSTV